MFLSDKNLFLL